MDGVGDRIGDIEAIVFDKNFDEILGHLFIYSQHKKKRKNYKEKLRNSLGCFKDIVVVLATEHHFERTRAT